VPNDWTATEHLRPPTAQLLDGLKLIADVTRIKGVTFLPRLRSNVTRRWVHAPSDEREEFLGAPHIIEQVGRGTFGDGIRPGTPARRSRPKNSSPT
jgi:hypothetical protein